MLLRGTASVFPTQRISNDEILDLVRYHSRARYSGDVRTLLTAIAGKLRRIGIKNRFWRAKRERPYQLLEQACGLALRQAGVAAQSIDFLIYVGVDRAFAEPANACFVAKQLGMSRARTFDVGDACLGWSTASELAQALFSSGGGGTALVVSAEFPMREGGSVLPECFTFASQDEMDWKFPALTLGEAASASVLTTGGPIWRVVHESHNDYADLCTVNIGPPSDYAAESPKLGPDASRAFRAYGTELGLHVYRPAVRVLEQLVRQIGTPRFVFPHSVVGPYLDVVVERVSPDLHVFSTFPETGNLATASVPSAISVARKRHVIRGDEVTIGWAAASGLKVSAFEIALALG